MQTALQRRQRHRRNGAARRGRGGGAARRAALAIPLLLFASFLAIGGVGFVAVVSAYAHYSEGLTDPVDGIKAIAFEQPSIVYDRTGTVELARFGVLRRELVGFDDIPAEMIDATTSVEDKDFWTNPGFDMGAVISAGLESLSGGRQRGASTITQQLVRARLLPADAFEGSVYDRKIREIIQSIRLTQAYPGDEGKRAIMEAYLNQNFYGNQSYGVKAAAIGYFGVELDELTLAQYAVIAAIPQSPTKFDLMRNAIRECDVVIEEGEECPANKVKLVVPADSEIVVRRNFVLDQMKTRSVLSAGKHGAEEYDAAKAEELVLTPQVAAPWKAPHFVWQIRKQLGTLLCGEESAETCEAVDTGGYRIITSLDWDMQQTVEKWLLASTRVTHRKNPTDAWKALGIPKSEFGWLQNLRGANIHNGAAGVMDYRTGEVLAYAGSGGYYLEGSPKFQPQFDVMSDGIGRQLGSAIKPLNYIVGIDDHTLTAATMFMDVVTDFGVKGSGSFLPTQADGLERGPTRLRPALQMSFNIPSIKAGIEVGLEREFNRWKEFGLTYPPGAVPVVSQSVGAIETHPIEMLGAYGAIANGGVLMPRTMILEVKDKDGVTQYPTSEEPPVGRRVASPQASYIMTDILSGNTVKSVNPLWGAWQILDKTKDDTVRRPAAYKTGTTNDRKDTAAFGFLAEPKNKDAPALAVGVWMGNSDSTANNDALSLASAAPLWSRILTEISQGMPIAKFTDQKPGGLVTREVDAFSGLLPGPGTVKTVSEIFIKNTEPDRKDDLHVATAIDGATGLLWQEGCTGPRQTRTFLDFSQAEPGFAQWQRYTQEWAQRAARGVGVRGGPKGTRTMYFYNLSFHPFGATWGGRFKPTDVCSALVPCPPPELEPTPKPSKIVPCVPPEPTPTESHGGGPPTQEPGPTPTKKPVKPTPTPTSQPAGAGTESAAQGAIPLTATLPLILPLFGLVVGRWFRPARPPSRRHRPRRAPPRGPS